ncbi:LOW QUALITY PROTEIN: butyrophilin-like protein 1 [Dugong dugon]
MEMFMDYNAYSSEKGRQKSLLKFEHIYMFRKRTGVGSAPQVRINGLEEDGVRVACTAFGWFPKPQVQWRNCSLEKFLASSEVHAQDADGLSVEPSLVVRDSSVRNVTCSILNPILGQEKAKAIFIPEPFSPQASPWKPAFAVSLSMLVFVILGAGYFLKKEHSAKVQALKARDELQAELAQVCPLPLSLWHGHEDRVHGGQKWKIVAAGILLLGLFQIRALEEGPGVCRWFPHLVGVFLDCDFGDISFYNMTDGSHIFSFSLLSFTGTLHTSCLSQEMCL